MARSAAGEQGPCMSSAGYERAVYAQNSPSCIQGQASVRVVSVLVLVMVEVGRLVGWLFANTIGHVG